MVLTAYFVLSPVIGLFCHRRFRIWFCLRPVGPTSLRELDAGVEASGPHDFAVRFSISRQLAVYRSRGNPALPSRRALRRCRVHRIPCPTSVTIAKRPSVGRDSEGYRSDLGHAGKEIFLQSHIDEALVCSRRCQPLILVVLHGSARTGRRVARTLSSSLRGAKRRSNPGRRAGKATGSRECAPDDGLRVPTIQNTIY